MPLLPPRPLLLWPGLLREVATGASILAAISLAMVGGGIWSLLDGGFQGAAAHPLRWALLPFTVGRFLSLVGLAMLAAVSRSAIRTVRVARTCAAESEEVAFQVVAIRLVGENEEGTTFYRFNYLQPPSRPGGKNRVRTAPAGEPLLVERDGALWIVALRSGRFADNPVLPNQSFHPFSIPSDAAEVIRSKLWHPKGEWIAPGWSSEPK